MKLSINKKITYFVLMSAIILFTLCLHTKVFADCTVYVNNTTELLEQIALSKNKDSKVGTYNIKLNLGIYDINNRISIPSNTNIDLNGNVINLKNKDTAPIEYALLLGENTKNVEITNGTIIGGGIYAKTIDNLKINKITIKNCISEGIAIKEHSTNVELSMLNFESITSNSIYIVDSIINKLSYITSKKSARGIYLKTSKANNIENCDISDTSAEGIRIVSSHVENIKNNKIVNGNDVGILLRGPTDIVNGSSARNIESNTIKNCKGDGIGIYHGSYCKEIIKNTIDTIGGNHNGTDGDYGIIVDSMMKAETYCERIAQNTIKNVTYAGIAIYSGPGSSLSEIYHDTAYVEKNIENNLLINCGTYKHSPGWKDEFKQGCVSGIYIDTHSRVKGNICNNTVDKTGENGIYIHLCASVNNIKNNTIKDCKEYGIHIYRLSKVLQNIESNNIKNCGIDGIAVTKESTIYGLINLNTIENIAGNGIYIKTSSIKDIKNNKLNNIKGVGICLNEKANVRDIVSNTISMNNVNNGFGLRVVSKSIVKKINENMLKCDMVNAIRIVGIANNMEIVSNNISTTNPSKKAFLGIYVDGNNSKKVVITKNVIKGNKTNYGIRIASGKAEVLDNTVKKSSYPIYIEKNNATVKIKGNKISENSKNLVRTTKQKVDINNIKISNIKVEKSSKIKLNFKSSNRISKFDIFQATEKNGKYKRIKTTGKKSFTTPKLAKNKKYFYKVCGYVKDGNVTIYTKDSEIKSRRI